MHTIIIIMIAETLFLLSNSTRLFLISNIRSLRYSRKDSLVVVVVVVEEVQALLDHLPGKKCWRCQLHRFLENRIEFTFSHIWYHQSFLRIRIHLEPRLRLQRNAHRNSRQRRPRPLPRAFARQKTQLLP